MVNCWESGRVLMSETNISLLQEFDRFMREISLKIKLNENDSRLKVSSYIHCLTISVNNSINQSVPPNPLLDLLDLTLPAENITYFIFV